MIRLLYNTNFQFMRRWKTAALITALFILPAALLIPFRGFDYSIEFTGGTLVHARFQQEVAVDELRSALTAQGVTNVEITQFGSAREYNMRARITEAAEGEAPEQVAQNVATQIERGLAEAFGAGTFEIVRAEAVGPKVGGELRQRAAMAMLISFLVVMVYLAWRFEWRFGLAAVLAAVHDFLATLAFLYYLNFEISLVVVGAILTVIGYSLNDTIVIFDRVRENLKVHKKAPLADVLNRSVNETLPRTLMTGMTSIATLTTLLLFAGPVIAPFAWVLLFGVIVGTFSSIFVAAPLLLLIEQKWPRKKEDRARSASRTSAAARAAP
jgi:preprotein translocase subunit SecF